jgi:hypothetical protein
MTLSARIFLFLSFVSGAIWFGGSIVRSFIVYELFQGNEFQLKTIYNLDNLRIVFIAVNPLITSNIVSFLIFFISYILYVFSSKFNFKKEGWFFISIILFILILPTEFYMILNDYKVAALVFGGDFSTEEILGSTINRYKKLSSFPIINLLSFASIVFLFILKPFKK